MSRIITQFHVAPLEDEENYDLIATRDSEIAHETQGAVKFRLDGTDHWVPRTHVREDHRGLWVASWFVEEHGIGDD